MADVKKVDSICVTGGAPGWESPAAADMRSDLTATNLEVEPQMLPVPQDLDELEAVRAYTASMLADTASMVSRQKGGTKQNREAQVCMHVDLEALCRPDLSKLKRGCNLDIGPRTYNTSKACSAAAATSTTNDN